jgi:hypothetical protein
LPIKSNTVVKKPEDGTLGQYESEEWEKMKK